RTEAARSNAIVIDVSPNGNNKSRAFVPGNGLTEWFTDHPHGPEMVVVPAGTFTMGSPEDEPQRRLSEGPQHEITISQPFAVARHAITRAQLTAFVNSTNYIMGERKGVSWRNPSFHQDDSHPVVCVTWNDAMAYAQWLCAEAGKIYRLL